LQHLPNDSLPPEGGLVASRALVHHAEDLDEAFG
jgi:hypothetical protein